MRMKSIPVVAGLLLLATGASSCLSSEDKVVEVSTDARIMGLELEPVNGINYKFDIDQQKGIIFNADSLPVKSDTLMSAIAIKSVSARGWVAYSENDSILQLGRPVVIPEVDGVHQLKITSVAPDGKTRKIYKLIVNIHKQDPEGYSWTRKAVLGNKAGIARIMVLNGKFITFYSDGTAVADGLESRLPENADLSSVMEVEEKLLINDKDNRIFISENGRDWQQAGEQALRLVSYIYPHRLIAVKDGKLALSEDFGTTWKETEMVLPEGFPVKNLRSVSKGQGKETIVIGLMDDGKLTANPWFSYDGTDWAPLIASSEQKKMPRLDGMHLFVYNHKGMLAAEDLTKVFSTQTGMEWVEDKSFKIPENLKMENVALCTDGDYVYLVGKNSESGKYEVWRGYLNKLKFDK